MPQFLAAESVGPIGEAGTNPAESSHPTHGLPNKLKPIVCKDLKI